MNKKISKIKRDFTLCLIFLFSINTFATSVSNNDGSAFITKAEFDALKSSFQSEIDTYNQNIDNKIDDAISSYLSGVKIKPVNEYSLPLANWKKVTALNGKIDPSFQYPSVNLTRTRFNRSHSAAGTPQAWRRSGFTFINLKYTQAAGDSTRPCVLGMKENFSSITRMYWDGVYNNWLETIEADIVKAYNSDLYAIEMAGYTNIFYFYQLNKFTELPGGYKSDLNSYADTVWNGGFSYYSNYSGFGFMDYETSGTIKSRLLTLNINAKKDEDNYKHIIEYHNCDGWEVYNPTFKNTFRKSQLDTLKTKAWWNGGTGWTASKRWDELKYLYTSASKTYTYVTRVNNGTVNTTEKNYQNSIDTNASIPRVGLVKSDVSASDIKQDADVVTVAKKGALQSAQDVNLVNGFVLLYGTKDEEITWQPKFINLSSTDGIISATTEVEMQLSMIPFSDDVTVSDSSQKIKVDATYSDASVIRNTTTPYTSGKTVKLEWTMPNDGFVYIKWYPKLTTTSYLTSKQWQVDLDLENCGVYTSKIPTK